MMNNLMEFGSASTLIATAICDFESGKTSYKKGDVVFKLEDVIIKFNYGGKEVDIKTKRNNLYYSDSNLDSFTIQTSPFNLASQQLFGQLFEKEVELIEAENATSVDGIIILNGLPRSDTIQVKDVKEFEIMESEGICILRSLEFENNKTYTVFYKKKINSTSITLDNIDLNIPYLKIQIGMIGNNDKQTEQTYLIIEKAAVRLTPVINLGEKNVSNVQLYFKVIDGENKPILVVPDVKE